MPIGRQMCTILYNQRTSNKGLNTYYGIHGIGKVVWLGYSFAQISQFRDKWCRLIENLDPAVQIDEELLKHTLFTHMNSYKNLQIVNDLPDYSREPSAQTYYYLLNSMDRYIEIRILSITVGFNRMTIKVGLVLTKLRTKGKETNWRLGHCCGCGYGGWQRCDS